MKILVTGSSGFIAGYLIKDLLDLGHEVIGVDNYSKYGEIKKSYDDHSNYTLFCADAKDLSLIKELLQDCDHFIVLAAKIGGISYFHEFAYNLLEENELITATAFRAAINSKKLKKITVVSSSMVFENAFKFPTPEGHERECPPPMSTYGFQKLATEYFAQGAYREYRLPYTIIRPFNCVGMGEARALCDRTIKSGNINLAMSHVVPDLIHKIFKKQDPLHILGDGNQVRCYTYGGDISKGIIASLENKKARNEDFNISISTATTVKELAEKIFYKINPSKTLHLVHEKSFKYDVQKRIPDTSKAERLLEFKAETSLNESLDEVIPYIEKMIEEGNI